MNKLTKLLSVFVIAGAIGTGVAGVAGCNSNKGGNGGHDYRYEQISGNADQHKAICKNHEGEEKQENHTWNGDECSKCHYEKISAENATGIIVEYDDGLEITLSETTKTASIDLSKVKVYYKKDSTKGPEVPAADCTKTVGKDGEVITALTGLKQGHYEILVEVGSLEGSIEIDILNPEKANTLVKTSTGDTTYQQGSGDTLSASWTFEVTLANGDKQTVNSSDATVTGIDTLRPGAKKATVKYGDNQTLEVDYTVTAVEGMVVQSYAVNANTQTIGSNTSNKVLNEAGKISWTAKSGKNVDVDANAKSIDGKSFTQRIKLGGSPIKDGSLDGTTVFRTIKLEDVNKTTVEGATSKTLITVYAASSSEGTERTLALYKEGGTTAAPTLTLVEGDKASCGFTKIAKFVYEITDTGTFHIASASGGINIYYLQVDKVMTGETGAQDISLDGESKVIGLNLVTEGAKTVYKVNGTVDTSGITGNITLANELTAESKTQDITNADLTFDTSKVDMTKLGVYPVTVTYGEGGTAVTSTYNVTVESAVDGVKGAKATLKSDLNTAVETTDAKLTLKKGDITVAPEWTKNAVEGVTTTYTVKVGEEEIDATTGKEFAIGTYTLTVEISVTDGTNTATFTQTVTLKVTKKLAEGEVGEASFNASEIKDVPDGGMTVSADGLVLGDEAIAKVTALSECKVNANSTGDYTQRLQTSGGVTTTKKAVKVELKAKATITIVYKKGSADARIAGLYNSEGTVLQQDTAHGEDTKDSSTLFTHTFTAVETGTYYLGGTNGINIYEIIITPAE